MVIIFICINVFIYKKKIFYKKNEGGTQKKNKIGEIIRSSIDDYDFQ